MKNKNPKDENEMGILNSSYFTWTIFIICPNIFLPG